MNRLKTARKNWLFLAIGLLLLAGYCFAAFRRIFDRDELEHIHSAWYILHGSLPYKDFFQHHNPLLWYLLLPVLFLFGETTATLLAARMLMLLCSLVLLLFVGKTAALLPKDPEAKQKYGVLAALLTATTSLFYGTAFEIRPDGPMTTCAVLAFYFLFAFLREGKPFRLLLSGLFMGLSFLFLQKMVFLLLPYGGFFLFLLLKKRLSFRLCLGAALAALLPVVCLLAYLLANQMLPQYVFTNIVINAHQGDFAPVLFVPRYPLEFVAFVLFSLAPLAALLAAAFRRKVPEITLVCSLVCLVLFLSVFTVARRYDQYFYPVCPFLAIVLADGLLWLLRRRPPRAQLAALLAVGCYGLFLTAMLLYADLYVRVKTYTNTAQFKKIDYVLSLTDPEDAVYDGDILFNIYRRDVNYFWYSFDLGVAVTEKLTGETQVDVEADIWEHEPVVISTFKLPEDSDVLQNYDLGKYELLVRNYE